MQYLNLPEEWSRTQGPHFLGPVALNTRPEQAERDGGDAGLRAPAVPLLGSCAGERPRPLLSSTRWDKQPGLSPDARRVAFVSNRSGRCEAWLVAGDGSDLHRLRVLGAGRMVALPWAPTGRRLALSARRDDQSDLFVIDTTRDTTVSIDERGRQRAVPAWSTDRRLFS